MVIFSAGLINFNKYMLHPDRFPFPMHLILMHTVFCSSFAGLLFTVQPSLFPSLTDPERKVTVTPALILNSCLPIAVAYAGNLLFSNLAYLYSSVAFLQMMKEGNVAFIYGASLVVGLETFRWRNAGVLLFIIIATVANVEGEINFSLTGLLIQGVSQVFEVLRIILQSIILTGSGKLDALTYVMVVMPLCFMSLSCVMLARWLVPGLGGTGLVAPSAADVIAWWPLLLVNCSLAFMLNVSIALFLKYSSAVAMVLAGLVKDALVVVISGAFLHEAISTTQRFGFIAQLIGVAIWSTMKTFPLNFEEHGFVGGFVSVCSGIFVPASRDPFESRGKAGPAVLHNVQAPPPKSEASTKP
eukprot:CAMPEP_0170600532 /NCGR_PEP_ID=MMETSP0224-20130122/17385_1 /TAXON_ID=285029 /ORGANISM="Togula jolla, Strain CCCM 725" /LENGTH=356 /DNA_ID=CAMNT_0010925265 /DNA_START=214 /DNA_END=1284 /DNA_ORIENTATION=+